PAGAGADSSSGTTRAAPTPRTTVTGTTDANSVATNGGNLTISSGVTIDGNASDDEALVGKDLATKNNLVVGSTFTAYTKTFTVKGIYTTGNTFQDSGIIMPLATVQALTTQPGAVTELVVNADSSDNVTQVVSDLKTALGTAADITSAQQQAQTSVDSLGSISSLATTGVIGATVASAVIVLLTMTMIVRERKREIGVIKAIGGTNFKVITQFMTEALTLTIIGGIIGLAAGVAVSGSITQGLVDSQANSTTTSTTRGAGGPGGPGGNFGRTATAGLKAVTSSVTPTTIAGGIGLTLLIAIVGSALPAWFIARIRPAEVLRTE
ncbi:MAG: transporter permease, partial [Candidatus Saccharibacteria bacterium]|nr:transporter permease [Candidatus Saccharibacteria bacterium]